MNYLLAYISRSTVKNTAEILDDIAEISAAKNSKIGVTGILLLNGNYFFQLLEGREDLVKKTFEHIGKDTRHTEVKILAECYNEQRLFTDWFMRSFDLDAYYDIDVGAFRKKLNHIIGHQGINKVEDFVKLMKHFKDIIAATDIFRK